MLGLMGYSGSLPLCVTIIDIICMFINWANKDACLSSTLRWNSRIPAIKNRIMSSSYKDKINRVM